MNSTTAIEASTNGTYRISSLENVISHIPILKALESRHFLSAPFFGLIVFVSYIMWLSAASAPVVKGPVAGYRNFFDPTFLLRIRFIFSGVRIMTEGYHKVGFKLPICLAID